ncbi:MAG: DegT/DnrJ/EryC1/StrS family aminotransferase [Solirubrobacterales bacterium]
MRAGKSWPCWPQWDESERRRLQAVLESDAWCSAYGGEVEAFVAEFTAFQDAGHGVAVTNGTQALEAALSACGVGPGDEVIVPASTFVATATAAITRGATPVLVDVELPSCCIDPEAVAAATSDRTRAVIAVHLGGRACDMDALSGICGDRDIALVEDCAHSVGTRWRGRGTGTIGAAGAFSFQQSKLMTAGEGGIVTTEDPELFERAWSHANLGRIREREWYHHAVHGTNLRMTEWQGAVLRAQLERLPQQHRTREERGELLDAELGRLPGVRVQSGDPRMDSRARWAYGIHFDEEAFSGLSREGFEAALIQEGIPLGFRYPSLNELELFRQGNFTPAGNGTPPSYPAGSLPQAEEAAANMVWLDQRILLGTPEDTLDVARAIARIQASAGAVRLRTGKAAKIAGRLARSALGRRTAQLLNS